MRYALVMLLSTFPAMVWGQALDAVSPFLVKPYLQLGSTAPALDSLSLLWHGPDRDAAWSVEWRSKPGESWNHAVQPTWIRVAVPSVEPHRVYTAVLRFLTPGAPFAYRVVLDGKEVFRAAARARKGPGQAQRVAVVGDLPMNDQVARLTAWRLQRSRPDLVLVPGDIVYEDGRISEYRRHFYPFFNADRSGPEAGAPLLRSTLFVAAVGNHDVGNRGPRLPFARDPDAMAYYLYWDQPLNGPPMAVDGPDAPPLRPGPGWTWQAFLAAAGNAFPGKGNFSFDSGDSHWTILDSNPHVHWADKALQDWLTEDLAQAKGATWRFVVFHHPVFNLAEGNQYVDQWMGRIWPLLEQNRVDLVFTGHIHTYVRTQPMHFRPDPASLAALDPHTQQGPLQGELTWDRRFDGRTHTRADGVIHIVTGGGGAPLHLKGKAHLFRLKPCVARAVSQDHSYSLLDIKGRTLTFRQIDGRGTEVDRFTLTK